MKRHYLLLLTATLLTLTDCSNRKTNSQSDNSNAFLSLFQDISADNLHLYSPCDREDGKKYEGKQIDSTFHKYFAFDKRLVSYFDKKVGNVFSCYKFKLSNTKTGLIIRVPSQYSETEVDLCIWDNQTNKIIKRIELADAIGDGMWYFVKDAWLVDINKDGHLDIVTRKMEWWEEDEEETELDSTSSLADTTIGYIDGKEHTTDSLKIFLSTGDNYKLTNIAIDKTKYKVLDWNRK